MLNWDERFATGNDEIDAQHRQLIESINRLETLLGDPQVSAEECGRMLDFLDQYAIKHFRFEEGCTERWNCPYHEENKLGHHLFELLLKGFKEEFSINGASPQYLQALLSTLQQWVSHHILTVDTELKRCPKA